MEVKAILALAVLSADGRDVKTLVNLLFQFAFARLDTPGHARIALQAAVDVLLQQL